MSDNTTDSVYLYYSFGSKDFSIKDDYSFFSFITVEHIDSCLRKLHLHKASVPDNLASEHLVHFHPSLIIQIKLLFSMIVSHNFYL